MPPVDSMEPSSRESSPARIRSNVDLPVPLPPTRPVRSPGVICQSIFSNRSLWPKRLPARVSCSIGFAVEAGDESTSDLLSHRIISKTCQDVDGSHPMLEQQRFI